VGLGGVRLSRPESKKTSTVPKKIKKSERENLFEFPMVGRQLNSKSELKFCEIYRHLNGSLFQGDSLEWLKSLDKESVDLIFADPPYNINKAEWDKFENQEKHIRLLAKVLNPSIQNPKSKIRNRQFL
jgi:site-specific DNA-adenine methylase